MCVWAAIRTAFRWDRIRANVPEGNEFPFRVKVYRYRDVRYISYGGFAYYQVGVRVFAKERLRRDNVDVSNAVAIFAPKGTGLAVFGPFQRIWPFFFKRCPARDGDQRDNAQVYRARD